MTDRKKPKKPVRNPSHIVFPKAGPVRRVVEGRPLSCPTLQALSRRNIVGCPKAAAVRKLLIFVCPGRSALFEGDEKHHIVVLDGKELSSGFIGWRRSIVCFEVASRKDFANCAAAVCAYDVVESSQNRS
jgi:hypothetical protein